MNARIVAELQLRGLAAPSTTRIRGALVVRCCLVSHRATRAGLALLVRHVLALGHELSAELSAELALGDVAAPPPTPPAADVAALPASSGRSPAAAAPSESPP